MMHTVQLISPYPLKRGSSGASGYDLKAIWDADHETMTIHPGTARRFFTGVHLELPNGCEAQVRPRSSMSNKMILAHLGTIDSDYRGEIVVLLHNLWHREYVVRRGDRIAQLVFSRVEHPDLLRVESLSDTVRGTGGFGSTGR